MKKEQLLQQLGWPDPFATFQPRVTPTTQSWHFDHDFLEKIYREVPQPRVIVEVGSWLGRSAIETAKYYTTQLKWRDFTLVCVDTWLGSTEHWLRPVTHALLQCEDGYPTVYEHFMSNVYLAGLQEYILPLPQTSSNGSRVLSYFKLPIDWVYLDASHYTLDVLTDMSLYWPLLESGGVLMGDDWCWPTVRSGVLDFCEMHRLSLRQTYYSWAIVKP